MHTQILIQNEPPSDVENSPADALIDMPFLDRQTLGRQDLKIEILRLFMTQLQIHQRALQVKESYAELKVRAHTIKGAALGVGATALAQAAKRVEQPLLQGDAAPACAILELCRSIDETSAYVSGLLKQ